MRRIEAEAHADGHTYETMMRLAGAAVARAVERRADRGVVVALCGPGNNGGDALVAAGLLRGAGYDARVALCHRDGLGGPPEVAEQLEQAPCLVVDGSDGATLLRAWLAEADVWIDGLLGTGLARPIEGPLATVLRALAEARARRPGSLLVAVDVPSGLDADSGALDPLAVPADLTVTFGFPKHGQLRMPGASAVGELVLDDIGLGPERFAGDAAMVTPDWVRSLLPARPADGHKGTFGRLLVVAGSVTYTGAAYLAAAAAYRAGCGLVTAAVPASVRPVLAGLLPEATFLVLPEDLGVIARGAAPLVRQAWLASDALLVGPGLTTQRPAAEFLADLLGRQSTAHRHGMGFAAPAATAGDRGGDAGPDEGPAPRAVVDADALNLLAEGTTTGDAPPALSDLPAHCVLTPHPGEMARLTGRTADSIQSDRLAAARDAAREWGHVVVLKGALTVVAAPDGRTAVNPCALPALASAGTGDVLAGLIGGLLAQRLDAFEAAVVAVFVHGLAGRMAAEAVGARATTASDVLAFAGRALELVDRGDTEDRWRVRHPA